MPLRRLDEGISSKGGTAALQPGLSIVASRVYPGVPGGGVTPNMDGTCAVAPMHMTAPGFYVRRFTESASGGMSPKAAAISLSDRPLLRRFSLPFSPPLTGAGLAILWIEAPP